MTGVTRASKRGLGVLACLATILPVLTVGGPPSSATPAPAPAAPAQAEPQSFVPGPPVTMDITTVDATPVTSKDDYVAGSMLLGGVTYPLEIRGRGNSTWNWPKKPYKLKLADDAALLGMPADDEWVLLANYADRTSLRTQLAMALGSRVKAGWTPRTRFVDVTLNGQDLGLYVLTEQIEQGSNRASLPDGGYLLEIDHRFRNSGEAGFWSDRRTPVSFKDPDELTLKQRQKVRGAVNRFEKLLFGPDFTDPVDGYAKRIDVQSVIDWYLIEELFLNQDSNFFSSVNVTWVPKGKFAMGPIWDFDLSAGNHWRFGVPPDAWYYTRYGRRHWVNRMLQHPRFAMDVKQRWNEIRPVVDEMIASIPAAANAIRPSAEHNWKLWPTTTLEVLQGTIHADSFNGEVAYLQDWLTKRANWMGADEAIFARVGRAVTERKRVVNVPVRVLGPRTGPAQVHYFLSGGAAKLGKDFEMNDGTLVFAPGETVKKIPVTILGDQRREGNERIRIKLTPAAGGPRLGDPSVVALTIKSNDLRQR